LADANARSDLANAYFAAFFVFFFLLAASISSAVGLRILTLPPAFSMAAIADLEA
jgi:hypothetical protein